MNAPNDTESCIWRRIRRYSAVFAVAGLIQVPLASLLGPWLLLLFPLWLVSWPVVVTGRAWGEICHGGAGPAAATALVLLPWLGIYALGLPAAAHSTKAYVVYLIVLSLAGTVGAALVFASTDW